MWPGSRLARRRSGPLLLPRAELVGFALVHLRTRLHRRRGPHERMRRLLRAAALVAVAGARWRLRTRHFGPVRFGRAHGLGWRIGTRDVTRSSRTRWFVRTLSVFRRGRASRFIGALCVGRRRWASGLARMRRVAEFRCARSERLRVVVQKERAVELDCAYRRLGGSRRRPAV